MLPENLNPKGETATEGEIAIQSSLKTVGEVLGHAVVNLSNHTATGAIFEGKDFGELLKQHELIKGHEKYDLTEIEQSKVV